LEGCSVVQLKYNKICSESAGKDCRSYPVPICNIRANARPDGGQTGVALEVWKDKSKLTLQYKIGCRYLKSIRK
jgi:hypothetical protein